MEKYHYEFTKGFEIVEKGEREMLYLRRRGLELAKKHNANIRERLYNKELCKWQDMGYFTPAERYVDPWGNICALSEDGRNFWKVN